MKVIKYIGAIIFLLLGVSQVVPIYLIASGLLQGQGGEGTAYFAGKLVGHIFAVVLSLVVASKLFGSARRNSEADGGSV